MNRPPVLRDESAVSLIDRLQDRMMHWPDDCREDVIAIVKEFMNTASGNRSEGAVGAGGARSSDQTTVAPTPSDASEKQYIVTDHGGTETNYVTGECKHYGTGEYPSEIRVSDPRQDCPWKCETGNAKCLCANKPVMSDAPVRQSKAALPAVVSFLLGEGPLDDKWFGDEPPLTESGKYKRSYWWRSELRKAMEPYLNQPTESVSLEKCAIASANVRRKQYGLHPIKTLPNRDTDGSSDWHIVQETKAVLDAAGVKYVE